MKKAFLPCLSLLLCLSFCACAPSADGPREGAASLPPVLFQSETSFSSGGTEPFSQQAGGPFGEKPASSSSESGSEASADGEIQGVSLAGLGRVDFSDIDFVPEFSDHNLGTAFFASGKNEITVSVVQITGTCTGTPEGPGLVFSVDLTSETVAERVFTPEPDGAFFIRQRENTGELEALPDERLVEIAKDFLAVIRQLEG